MCILLQSMIFCTNLCTNLASKLLAFSVYTSHTVADNREIITMNWKKAPPLTQTQWIHRLKQVHVTEYMTARLQKKMDIFLQRWASVIILYYLNAISVLTLTSH